MRDEIQPQVTLGNSLQMNLIELKKADRLGLPPGPLRAWITFFKHWQEELTMTTVTYEPVIKAMNRLRELSADEEARRRAFVRERALHDEVSFLNEAKREGMQEGMEKGRLDEARDALRVQLNTKFGALPSWVEEQLGTAEHERLRALMRDLLFADSLDGLFKH